MNFNIQKYKKPANIILLCSLCFVKKIEKTTSVDLTGREKWTLRLGYALSEAIFYNFTIDNKDITALPKKGLYHFDASNKEGDIVKKNSAAMYITRMLY